MAVTCAPAAAKCIHKVTEEETEAKGELLAGLTPGKFMLLLYLDCFPDFSPSLNYNSTDSSSFCHNIKSSSDATKCFLTSLVFLLPWGFLKGSSDEAAFWPNVITHPKAAEGIKSMNSNPFPCCKTRIFWRTRSLRCLGRSKISDQSGGKKNKYRIVIDVSKDRGNELSFWITPAWAHAVMWEFQPLGCYTAGQSRAWVTPLPLAPWEVVPRVPSHAGVDGTSWHSQALLLGMLCLPTS